MKLIFIEIVLYTCFYYAIILYERDIGKEAENRN